MPKKLNYSGRCSIHFPDEPIETTKVGYPKVVQKVEDGKVVNSVEFVVEDGENNEYQFNDFALENLLASGVELKPAQFTAISLRAVDDFVRFSEGFTLNVESSN